MFEKIAYIFFFSQGIRFIVSINVTLTFPRRKYNSEIYSHGCLEDLQLKVASMRTAARDSYFLTRLENKYADDYSRFKEAGFSSRDGAARRRGINQRIVKGNAITTKPRRGRSN